MTYLRPRNNHILKGSRLIFSVAVMIVVFVGILISLRPHLLPALFTTMARPFWRIQASVDMGSLSTAENLLVINQSLKRDLDAMSVRLQSQSAIESENADLKTLMGRASSTPLLLAAVIMRPPLAPYDELVIDIGSNSGVLPGDLVYAAESVPIGKVADVFGETSKVILFSSPDQKYDVEIGKSRVAATAIGRGGGQYMAELPRAINVETGDLVLIPSIFTKTFGIVSGVSSDPALPFQTVLFATPVSLYNLHWVSLDQHPKKKQ